MKFLNRPISPHLTVYSPQLSSLFSIWHRLAALFMTSLVFGTQIYPKVIFWGSSLLPLLPFNISNLFIYYSIFVILTIVCYHLLNGIRHILWDLALLLNIQTITTTSRIILLLIVGLQTLFLKNLCGI